MSEKEIISNWARQHSIDVLWPEQFTSGRGQACFLSLAELYGFEPNVCIDYGKFIERTPFFVLRPTTLDEVIACVAFLNDHSIPYKVRGAGHSAGGQVLTDNGAVMVLSKLERIVQDSPNTEEILVEGGIWWLHLTQYLQRQGRRPTVLTDNLRTTVSGTLSVGGFGDTTHLYGLQIDSVTELTLITPDAQIHQLEPSQNLFRYALAGRGQLGIIAQAKLKTHRRSSMLAARILEWHSVPEFVEDAIRIINTQLYEFCRMRVHFQPESVNRNRVSGVGGNFENEIPAYDASAETLKCAKISAYQQFDFLQHFSQDASENWTLCSPAVEMILPLPDGLRAWQQINRQIVKSGLFRYLDRGSSIMVLRNTRRYPLAPLPNTDFCMMIALRPAMSLRSVAQYMPILHQIQAQALEAGGKIYMMSIETEIPDFLNVQFGSALVELVSLKRELDPKRLLNPGLLC